MKAVYEISGQMNGILDSSIPEMRIDENIIRHNELMYDRQAA